MRNSQVGDIESI